jgi:hypothetical protein
MAASRLSSVVRGSCAVMPAQTSTVVLAEAGVGLRHLLGADAHHAPLERGRQPVPLAGSAGREDHVRAVAVLDHVTDEAALVVLAELAPAVEHAHDRHREPAPRSGVLDAPHGGRS